MENIGIEESVLCPCILQAQTTAHDLHSCPLHKEKYLVNREFPKTFNGTITNLRLTCCSSPWRDYKLYDKTSNAE